MIIDCTNLLLQNIKMITLTETAIKKIKENLTNRGRGVGIKIGVRTTGCSGLAYSLEYIDNMIGLGKENKIYHSDPAVVVDDKSIVYLRGMTVDYVKRGLNEGFEFINPNEAARCGCGESFTI